MNRATIAASKKQHGDATFRRNSTVLRTPAARRCEASGTRKRFEPAAHERGRASIGVRASGKPWLRPNELSEKDLTSGSKLHTPPTGENPWSGAELGRCGPLGSPGSLPTIPR